MPGTVAANEASTHEAPELARWSNTGNRTMTVVPAPGVLLMVSEPPCRSTRPLANGRPSPGTASFRCSSAGCLGEWLQNTRQILGTDADAGIAHAKLNPAIARLRHIGRDSATARGELQGIR